MVLDWGAPGIFGLYGLWTGVGVAYQLDDVHAGQEGLIIGRTKESWRIIAGARILVQDTNRSLAWAIVRLVLAVSVFLYGVLYVAIGAPAVFPEWSVLATGGVFALIAVVLGGRPLVTCWQTGRYALLIDMVGEPVPVAIRPSHRRQTVVRKAREINTRVGRSGAPVYIYAPWAQGIQVGDHNQQYNTFPPHRFRG